MRTWITFEWNLWGWIRVVIVRLIMFVTSLWWSSNELILLENEVTLHTFYKYLWIQWWAAHVSLCSKFSNIMCIFSVVVDTTRGLAKSLSLSHTRTLMSIWSHYDTWLLHKPFIIITIRIWMMCNCHVSHENYHASLGL